MSWSVAAIGKAPAVRKEIADQFSRGKCNEPEETIRLQAAKLIDMALEATDPSYVVKVYANGHQSYTDWNKKANSNNAFNMVLEPQHGFLE